MLDGNSYIDSRSDELVSFLERRMGALINTFSERWILLQPAKNSDDFRSEILDRIKLDFKDSPDLINGRGEADLKKIVGRVLELSPKGKENDFLHIYLGSVFALGAAISLDEKDIIKCILLLWNAHNSYGVLEFVHFNFRLWAEQVAKSTLKMQSRKGVDSRDEKLQQITKIVFDYVRSEAPWPSRAEAVRKSVKRLEELGLPRTEETVNKWLKVMPNHESLWPKR